MNGRQSEGEVVNGIADWGSRIAGPELDRHAEREIREAGSGYSAAVMKDRTRQYALRVIELVESLPRTRTADVIARQLLRSATSVGANYRAACRAKSTADFIAKMGIVEEEADETLYWLELLVDAKLVGQQHVSGLQREGNQLVAIVVASIRTSRSGLRTTPVRSSPGTTSRTPSGPRNPQSAIRNTHQQATP